MQRFVLQLLLLILPIPAFLQSSIPRNILALPISDEVLKSEFSIRYNLHAKLPNQPDAIRFYSWDKIDPGYYFPAIELERELLTEVVGLKLVRLTLVAGLNLSGKEYNITCMKTDVIPPPSPKQYFLIGIDESGNIYYLSGNTFLDPLDKCLSNSDDLLITAKIRLYYLSPGELIPLKAKPGHTRFETRSTLLQKQIVIDLQDQNRFRIFPKGDENHPIATFGDWVKK